MKKKLWFLVGVSLDRKIKTKWFLAAQIMMLLVAVALINIETIITLFGGDFTDANKIYVVDDTNNSYELFHESLALNEIGMHGEGSNRFEVILIETLEEIIDTVDSEGGIIVHIIPDEDNVIGVELISKTTVDTLTFLLIQSSVNNVKTLLTLDILGLTLEDYHLIMSDVVIERSLTDSLATTEEENMEMIMTTVFPIIILPVFLLSMVLIQMIGAEVNDEKTTKAMEIIISNVPPKIHFFAKIIAGNAFIFIQAALLLLYGWLALMISNLLAPVTSSTGIMDTVNMSMNTVMNSSIGSQLVFIIPLTIVLILLTFIAYSLLAGILASMTTTIEDYQQIQIPIIVLSLGGFYLAMLAGFFRGSLFIEVLSYVPFISAILSPSLLVLGQIGLMQVLISMLIMIVTNYLLIRYGLKIYKVGILNYSSTGLWKKMFKAMKN